MDDPLPAFHAPLAGVPMVDLFYGGYLDHDPGPGTRDYECGRQTYDGHTGVDIALRNFQVQDTGVVVLAAARGTVITAVDGLPDRNTSWEQGGGYGNHVVLAHEGDVRSYYGHLRLNSVAVEPGQTVEVGTVLGLVGSSGISNWPHLHFEVRKGGVHTDPFTGECAANGTMWAQQLPYQDDFMVMDAGITDILPTTREVLLERPPSLHEVPGDVDMVGFWIQFANQPASHIRVDVIQPGADEPAHRVSGNVGYTWIRYLTAQIPVLGVLSEPGDWEIRTYQDHVLIWTEAFVVTGTAEAPRPPAAPPTHDARMLRIEVHDQVPGSR